MYFPTSTPSMLSAAVLLLLSVGSSVVTALPTTTTPIARRQPNNEILPIRNSAGAVDCTSTLNQNIGLCPFPADLDCADANIRAQNPARCPFDPNNGPEVPQTGRSVVLIRGADGELDCTAVDMANLGLCPFPAGLDCSDELNLLELSGFCPFDPRNPGEDRIRTALGN